MPTHADDLKSCRLLLRSGSRSFYAASFLLPRKVRNAATALYAFCRLADDAIDLGDNPAQALTDLRMRLARAYDGSPDDVPADRAFAKVVREYAIPRALPEALLEGIAWDASGLRYESLSALYSYAARVAGSVGAMMSLLMDRRDPDTVARACDLGIAMQLSNIARDLSEDARAGRLYLPIAWLREASIDPDAWIAQPEWTAAIGTMVQRLLSHAELLYAQAAVGIDDLPATCRPGIHAARLLYSEIGREVGRLGAESLRRRAVIPAQRKAQKLMQAILATRNASTAIKCACLPEASFLVEAVTDHFGLVGDKPTNVIDQFDRRAAWLIELFMRLEREHRPNDRAVERRRVRVTRPRTQLRVIARSPS